MNQKPPPKQFVKTPINGTKSVILVSSAKGGVGKSTVAINLAFALQNLGLKIGILDADVYGPSLPKLINLNEKPKSEDGKAMVPLEKYGAQCMSMGFLVDEQTPMIWRGPMVISAIKSFLNNVSWGELDCLFVDLPPGTGDAILTFAQELDVSSSIIITTPQKLSITDANRGIEMFKKTNIPVLGVIENMSFISDQNNNKSYPFGENGANQLCKDQKVDLLDKIRIDETFNLCTNNGVVYEGLADDIKFQFSKISERIIN